MPSTSRIRSVDFLRGLVMIIMALDHTRDLFHWSAFVQDPLDLTTTSPALFFTRWITHYCAPTFVFLSGTSVFLQSLRKPAAELRRFLVSRGLWLIFIEFAIVTLGISFNIFYNNLFFQVIWAIGISMILLSLISRLPFKAVLAIGLIITLGHSVLDFFEKGAETPMIIQLLHRISIIPIGPNFTLQILYPFLPWFGIMTLGYCFGKIYTYEPPRRKKMMIQLGAGAILTFIILRALAFYGDPKPWSEQKTVLYTIFDFIETQKYPPSLLYFLMTIGPSILILAFSEQWNSRVTRIVTVYGNVPFFYYLLHFYFLHIASAILFLMRGESLHDGVYGINQFFIHFARPGEGYSLQVVYVVWILLIIVLYPLCKWYGNYKRTHDYVWLSYL